MDVVAEFTIEPFVEGAPGAHVQAGLDAMHRAGLDAEMGPFGSTVRGEVEAVGQAVAAMVIAATEAGASRVSLQITRHGD